MNTEKVDVYMPLYVADYLADTTDLTAEEHGVYFLLLMNLWKRGGRLACEPTRLARMVGLSVADWERVWAAIGRFFSFDDGHIVQRRLCRELSKAKALRQAAAENGRKGAEVRWGGHAPANGKPNGVADGLAIVSPMANGMAKNGSSPSPSESPSEPESPPPPPPTEKDPPAEAAGDDPGSDPDTTPTEADQIRAVFAHYRTHHPRAMRKPSSKSKEWRLVRERLREGSTVDDLKDAIDGYHVSPFHCGENKTGEKYHDLDLIVRDGSHVTKGIRYLEEHGKGSPVMSERERKGVRASVSWLERTRSVEDAGP